MCGIVGFTGSKNAVCFLLEALERLEYRGYDSAGLGILKNGHTKIIKTVDRIGSLKAEVQCANEFTGDIGIGHTRWATHGAPLIKNAHPHTDKNKKFSVVHNGIIENYAILREELETEGVVFKSQTDTEVIPHLLNKYYKGNLKEAVDKTVSRLSGSYALSIICSDYPDTLVAVKQFSPLIIGLGNGENYIASDSTAVISKTRRIIYLEDGQSAYITPDSILVYNKDGKKTFYKETLIDWDITAAEKGGFDHFMLKEIFEQPLAISRTINSHTKDKSIFFENVTLDDNFIKSINKITIAACGSAYHAGIVGKYVLEELLRIPVNVELASEFRYRNPIIDSKTLVILISQSGETADTLAALREAKCRGGHTLSIVNVVGSSISKESDSVIYTHAGPEIAVATTKGYTTQLCAIYLFAVWFAQKIETPCKNQLDEILNEIFLLPEKTEQILSHKEDIAEIAKKRGKPNSLFFIGRNLDYAAALEASLKLKEISYLHSEAYAAGELKHGTISLIEKGVTVIAFCSLNSLFEKTLSNIKEVFARGAQVVACATEGSSHIENEVAEVIYIPKTHPLLTASLEAIPFQLYAYYTALNKGCDIDKPRNLAKSVTVE